MDRYRILFMTSSLRVGGAENHILNLCRYLASNGHEPAVCTFSPVEEGLENVFVSEGISLFRIPLASLRFLPSPRIASAVRKIVTEFNPHVLHAHLFHAEVAAAFASLFTRAPVIATRHSAGLEFGGWRGSASRMFEPRFAACIAVSREAAAEARANGWSSAKVTVLPNAVDPQRFRPLDGAEREKRRTALAVELFGVPAPGKFVLIGSVGGLKPVKNFPLMLGVASRLIRERARASAGPDLRFVIFGEGSEGGSLSRLSRDLGVEAHFALPGRREDLEDLYPLLDIFMLPSLTEGVPLALLEAMSSGVACVASDVGGVGEIIADAGRLVPSRDEDAFARTVKDLVDNKDIRMEFGRKARVRILERYNLDIWGEKMLDIYRSALARSASR